MTIETPPAPPETTPPASKPPVTLTAQRIEATVAAGGRLLLENLPFGAGQAVEVIVLPSAPEPRAAVPSADGPATAVPTPPHPLRGGPYRYDDPFGPAVPEEYWEALR